MMADLTARLSRIPCAGLCCGMLSGFFFAAAGFTVTLIPINPIEIVVIRGIFQTLIYTPIVLVSGESLFGIEGERRHLVTRGFGGFFSFALTFVAIYLISLGDASTIVFSAPIIVMVIATFVLGEECGLFQSFVLTLTVIGVALVSRPSFLFPDPDAILTGEGNIRMYGTLVAVGAALAVAISIVSIRQMPRTSDPVVINAFSVISIFLGLAILLVIHVMGDNAGFLAENIRIPTSANDLSFLLLNCIFGLLDQVFLTLALKLEEAGLIALARSIEVVVAFLFQLIWLPTSVVYWTSVAGAAVVVTSVALSALKRWLSSRPDDWTTVWIILNCGNKDRKNVTVDEENNVCVCVPSKVLTMK